MILRCASNRKIFSAASAGREVWRANRGALGPSRHLVTCRVCFDELCQQQADLANALALFIPVAVAGGGAWLVASSSSVPQQALDEGRVFEDKESGNVLGSPESEPPERDKNNEVVLRVLSYTPYPIPASFEGTRVTMKVGNIRSREKRTFAFPPILPQPSMIFTTDLDRPLGVVLAWDEKRKVAFIEDLLEGSNGERAMKVAAMSPNRQQAEVPMVGDIVRACTTATFTFKGAGALVGAAAPERTIVVYCPDGKKSGQWSDLRNAMKGESRDGPVTLVLERKIEQCSTPTTAQLDGI